MGGNRKSRKSIKYASGGIGEVSLDIVQAYGCSNSPTLREQVLFADAAGQYLAYPIGRYVSLRHTARGEANFVLESPKVLRVSACALSRSRAFLAVCEECAIPIPDGASVAPTGPASPAPTMATAMTMQQTMTGTTTAAAFGNLSGTGSTAHLGGSLEREDEETVFSEPTRTQVTLYGLKVVNSSADQQPAKTLQDLGGVGRISALALSGDAEATRLVVASMAPELLLAVLDWRRNQVLGRVHLSETATRISISPMSENLIAATGGGSLRLWTLPEEGNGSTAVDLADEIAEGDLKLADELVCLDIPSQLQEKSSSFADHAWIEPADGTLVACTEHGVMNIVLARSDAEVRILRTVTACVVLPGDSEVTVVCLKCFSNGIMFGCSNGVLSLWERPSAELEDHHAMAMEEPETLAELFEHVQSCCILRDDSFYKPEKGEAPAITCVDVTARGTEGDERIVVGLSGSNLGLLPLDDFRAGKNAADGESVCCEFLCGGFHRGKISSLDIALTRPLLITVCRQESAVHIWNYSTKKCELRSIFPNEDPLHAAIHPMGYLVAVTFADKLRIFQVLVDVLKVFREIPLRAGALVRFSNGGHLLAVAQGKTVHMFSVRNMTRVGKLQHSQTVVALSFQSDDRLLSTCSEDGGLIEWNCHTWNKSTEVFADRGGYTEALAVASGDTSANIYMAVIINNRCCLKTYSDGNPVRRRPDPELPENVFVRAMCQHEGQTGSVVFAVTSSGALYYWTETATEMVRKELYLHSGPITDLRLSADGTTLVTCGEDGAIFVLDVTGLANTEDANSSGIKAVEVVMINRGDIQSREEEIQHLASEAASLKVQLVEDAARMRAETNRRVALARQQDQEEIRLLQSKCEALQTQATAQERETLREMKAMEAAHVKAADRLESDYDKEVLSEAYRFRDLEADLVKCAEQLINLKEESAKKLLAERENQSTFLTQSVDNKRREVDQLKELVNFSKLRFDSMLDQEALEQELERSDIARRDEAEMEKQKMIEYKLKKEQDTMLRGLDMMEKDRDRAAKEQFETDRSVRTLNEQVARLQGKVTELKQERQEREVNLREKELEIGSYKVKVNTLKKFKHVLDFRLQEVTMSLLPKDELIQDLGRKLTELEEEFEENLDIHKQMKVRLKEADADIEDRNKECHQLKEAIKVREREIFRFCEDLRALATKEQDVRKWPAGLKALYRTHVKPERLSKDYGNEAMQELALQIGITEKTAATLACKGRHAEQECRTDLMSRVDENLELIKELDKLRKDRKELVSQAKELELQVQKAVKRKEEFDRRSASSNLMALQDATFGAESPTAHLDASGLFGTTALAQAHPGSANAAPQRSGSADVSASAYRARANSNSNAMPRPTSGPSPRTKVGNSASAGMLRKSNVAHRTLEERDAMQQLLAAADLRNQQVKLQALEHKLLKDQLEHLEQMEEASAAVAAATAMPAGAAHQVARHKRDR